MRTFLSLVIIIFTQSVFGQNVNLEGHVMDSADRTDFVGLYIHIMKEGKVIQSGMTNEKGNYQINNIPSGTYDIKLSFIGYNDKMIGNYLISTDSKFDFIYPFPCEHSNKICPYGHKNKLIPIVYGLPNLRMMKRAERGKIKLGGCIVTDCDPKWYCKEHKIEF